jgi:hypothetical protein
MTAKNPDNFVIVFGIIGVIYVPFLNQPQLHFQSLFFLKHKKTA